jgi:poly-gamma-glutamate biosynthesis protein PgsC/CapC
MHYETVFIGILLALLYVEVMGLYPGGIIVPAFLALTLDQPLRALATAGVACLTLLTYKAAARYFILFGRRRFAVMLLAGGFWAQAWVLLAPDFFRAPLELKAVGLIIPGLLANNLERQRFWPTLASLLTVVVSTYFLASVLRLIF